MKYNIGDHVNTVDGAGTVKEFIVDGDKTVYGIHMDANTFDERDIRFYKEEHIGDNPAPHREA